MALALIIALPFLGIFLPLLLERFGRSACAFGAGLAPLTALILLLTKRADVFAGQTEIIHYEWLPQLGLNLSLRLDGLGFLFALLILGIGLLVIGFMGHSRLYNAVIGGTSDRLVDHSPCAVLVVK